MQFNHTKEKSYLIIVSHDSLRHELCIVLLFKNNDTTIICMSQQRILVWLQTPQLISFTRMRLCSAVKVDDGTIRHTVFCKIYAHDSDGTEKDEFTD